MSSPEFMIYLKTYTVSSNTEKKNTYLFSPPLFPFIKGIFITKPLCSSSVSVSVSVFLSMSL